MLNVGVFFGSRAAEHDVSIITGLQLLENADKAKYNIFPVYISREGEWFIGEKLLDMASYKPFSPDAKGLTRVFLPPVPAMRGLFTSEGGLFTKLKKVAELDVAVLAFHGMHGEDGTVQGLLELADVPYTSSGVVASAAGMDKIVMKGIFKSLGLNVLEYAWCERGEWKKDQETVVARAEELGYPLYVKPANLGSSIGIAKATNRDTLVKAIDVASGFDSRILIERGLEKPTELNCACLGAGKDCTASLVEEPVAWDEFLTFDEKYMRNNSGKGMENLSRKIPAPISGELTEEIRESTRRIFAEFNCKGVVRVDYMLDRASDTLYVCEINTIPGSMAFYLFEPMGIKYRELIDKLIATAISAHEEKKASSYAFRSGILDKAVKGSKLTKK